MIDPNQTFFIELLTNIKGSISFSCWAGLSLPVVTKSSNILSPWSR